jgi:hypothetical protein
MRQRFTKWYAQKYGYGPGPWWVKILLVFLFSPSVYYYVLAEKIESEMVRVNVYSITNEDIDFDISVPRKYLDKVVTLIPKCGRAWYDYEGFWELGWSEPLRMALDKLGINYIYHGPTFGIASADIYVAFA